MKKIFSYILMPFSFALIGCIVICLVGEPMIECAVDTAVMTMKNGSPYGYTASILSKEELSRQEEQEELEPVVNEQYGVLECEAVQMEVPVFYGDSKKVFAKGAGQYIRSSLPGEPGITLIGAHDTTYFASLEYMAEGDLISITTAAGIYRYEVDEIKIGLSDDINRKTLNIDEDRLMLYTCYPFGQIGTTREQRYFVSAKRIIDEETE